MTKLLKDWPDLREFSQIFGDFGQFPSTFGSFDPDVLIICEDKVSSISKKKSLYLMNSLFANFFA